MEFFYTKGNADLEKMEKVCNIYKKADNVYSYETKEEISNLINNDSYTYIKDVASSNGDFDVCLDVQQAVSNFDGIQKMYVELIDANSINNVVSICLEAKQSSSGLLSSLNYMAASASLKGVDEYGSSIKASKYLSGNLAQVYLKYYSEEKWIRTNEHGKNNALAIL